MNLDMLYDYVDQNNIAGHIMTYRTYVKKPM